MPIVPLPQVLEHPLVGCSVLPSSEDAKQVCIRAQIANASDNLIPANCKRQAGVRLATQQFDSPAQLDDNLRYQTVRHPLLLDRDARRFVRALVTLRDFGVDTRVFPYDTLPLSDRNKAVAGDLFRSTVAPARRDPPTGLCRLLRGNRRCGALFGRMRCYFDTRDNDTFSRDEEGMEFASFDDLKMEAIKALIDFARDVRPGQVRRRLSISARDEAGRVVLVTGIVFEVNTPAEN